MSEMIATANANIEEIQVLLSRQKKPKMPYETHPADRKRRCVFGGSSIPLTFFPLTAPGNRRFVPVAVGQAEVHILADEKASERISTRCGRGNGDYRSGRFRACGSARQ